MQRPHTRIYFLVPLIRLVYFLNATRGVGDFYGNPDRNTREEQASSY